MWTRTLSFTWDWVDVPVGSATTFSPLLKVWRFSLLLNGRCLVILVCLTAWPSEHECWMETCDLSQLVKYKCWLNTNQWHVGGVGLAFILNGGEQRSFAMGLWTTSFTGFSMCCTASYKEKKQKGRKLNDNWSLIWSVINCLLFQYMLRDILLIFLRSNVETNSA